MIAKRRVGLWASLSLNLLLLLCIWGIVRQLGGWNYTLYRLRHNEAGLYQHRKQLFEQMPARTGAIVFLGDSQTEQCEWQELFYPDTALVLNRGITGDHMAGILGRLKEVTRHKPRRIYLLVGINDLIFGKKPEEIARQYQEIVAALRQASPNSELFLQSVLPVNNDVKKIGVENERIQQLNLEIASIARDYALPYVDLYSRLTDSSGNLAPRFTQDGIHLNALGYQAWKTALQDSSSLIRQ